MRCLTAQKHSSAYLDGDLSSEKTSAIRGHLRICESCQECFAEEARLIESAGELEALDPPDSVWQGIVSKIAEAEIADGAEQGRTNLVGERLWTSVIASWRLHLVGATALCAALALLYIQSSDSTESAQGVSQMEELSSPEVRVSVVPPEQVASSAWNAKAADYREERELTVELADRDYLQTIADLREILEEDRTSWSAQERELVDEKMASFKREGIGARLALGDTTTVRSRDALYQHYQQEIHFLQSALAGDLPSGIGD